MNQKKSGNVRTYSITLLVTKKRERYYFHPFITLLAILKNCLPSKHAYIQLTKHACLFEHY